ncbi:MAG TPA: hypothetical protein VFS95_11490 [Telluria sp.]|nr:hypothetical protein [Telluria sp.]
MLSERRASVCWGLALTAAVHGALWLLVSHSGMRRQPLAAAGPVLQVSMVPAASAPEPVTSVLLPPAQDAPELPPIEVPAPELPPEALPPKRDEIVYLGQDELDTKVVVLKDETGDADFDAPEGVVMHLFIDARGHVAVIRFAGTAIDAELEEKLRRAFMGLEFTPGIKDGKAVASRIVIALTGPEGQK